MYFYSTVVVWALSKTNNRGMPTFDALYQAAFSGTTDCKVFTFIQFMLSITLCDLFAYVAGQVSREL